MEKRSRLESAGGSRSSGQTASEARCPHRAAHNLWTQRCSSRLRCPTVPPPPSRPSTPSSPRSSLAQPARCHRLRQRPFRARTVAHAGHAGAPRHDSERVRHRAPVSGRYLDRREQHTDVPPGIPFEARSSPNDAPRARSACLPRSAPAAVPSSAPGARCEPSSRR